MASTPWEGFQASVSLSAQSRAVRGPTLAAVGFPPAAFHFTPHASFHIVERRHRGAADAHPLDTAYRHRRAVGLVLQFVLLAVLVDRAAGDAGKFECHEVADLLAESGGRFDGWHRQAVGLRPVL